MDGFAAWHRAAQDGAWGHHIRAVSLADRSAGSAAKRWARRFLRRR